MTVPAKGRWMFGDMQRWARRYGVRMALNPHFPINTLAMMRGAVGLQLRAFPLLELLSAANQQQCDVMWNAGAPLI